MSTSAQVVRIAPSLSGDSRISDELTVVAAQLSATQFGDRWSEAVAALTAHRLLSSPEGGSGMGLGSVSSTKAGKRQVSYAQPSFSASSLDDAALMTTAAGRYFVQLRSMAARIRPFVLM